ncbi:DEKNAAC101503 [Brettanomyces naardenensis]|uniref:DEKNAAC101503 n=1 Tax=Brettanomyces naardenensis TaxID=13370 RepID=A0A448YI82_BRENA|nr:DEKNAAC101503 [Brettanomyces naardenensis]
MYRVENYGFEIGFKVTDCLVYERNVKEGVNMKLSDSLEIMKFICRDVWKVFYGKQMDNLRTNHIGTFVLIENSFKPLVHFSTGKGEADTVRKAAPYLQFPCGLIRGILASLGVDSVVKAELNGKFPSVSFNVQTS